MPTDFARAVVDTNVLLSAALVPQGVPAQLLDKLLTEGQLVFSPVTFAELKTRIWKPKFDRYLSIERRNRALQAFNAGALWVDVPSAITAQAYSRDANDDAFVHAALAAGATRLISGDADLLCLHPLGSLQIISPRAALDEMIKLGNMGRAG